MGTRTRVPSIDLVRGLVIALMALDHVRDYFGPTPWGPEDLAHTTPAWFWTRWITHLCATGFVLLAGSSAFLRGRVTGIPPLSRYLATRGALLLALEFTWVSFSWQFAFNVFILQVIWALGVGMLLLALLVHLPRWAVIAVAAVLILPHNLLDSIHTGTWWWRAWHQGGFFPLPSGVQGIVFAYPLMPWLGWIAAGYAIGPIFVQAQTTRQRFLWLAAAALMLVFLALRAANLYGDPDPWSPQGRGWMFDLISFVRVHKYPPSLLYLCVTGSIVLGLLAIAEKVARPPAMLMLFGRVPQFFYLVHVALIHLLGVLYFRARFGSEPSFGPNGFNGPPGYAPTLIVVYLAWAAVLMLMYGLCLAWSRRGGQRQAALGLG